MGQSDESWLIDYGWLPSLADLDEIIAREYREGPAWHIARNTGSDYIAQRCREKLVEKNQRGIPEQVWHQTGRDNHLGDCEKLQLVCRYLCAGT